jgi:formylglycine-generating enzyme required for sulfatase activity
MTVSKLYFLLILELCIFSCTKTEKPTENKSQDSIHACMKVPSRFSASDSSQTQIPSSGDNSVEGMVKIPSGTFEMGAIITKPLQMNIQNIK